MKKTIIDSASERTYILEDDLLSGHIKGFEEELVDFIKDDPRDILIDLGNITKIDSMSIALILRVKSKLVNNNRALKLTNPSEGIIRILELAGLNDFLLD